MNGRADAPDETLELPVAVGNRVTPVPPLRSVRAR